MGNRCLHGRLLRSGRSTSDNAAGLDIFAASSSDRGGRVKSLLVHPPTAQGSTSKLSVNLGQEIQDVPGGGNWTNVCTEGEHLWRPGQRGYLDFYGTALRTCRWLIPQPPVQERRRATIPGDYRVVADGASDKRALRGDRYWDRTDPDVFHRWVGAVKATATTRPCSRTPPGQQLVVGQSGRPRRPIGPRSGPHQCGTAGDRPLRPPHCPPASPHASVSVPTPL